MKPLDILRFALRAVTAYPLRTALMLLAMSIGVAAVVMLTALGDGARQYVVNEFNALGSNLLIVLPGRSETRGVNPANFFTETPRDLSIGDADAMHRVAGVVRVAPMVAGTSEVAFGGKLREAMVVGTAHDYLALRRFQLAQGQFLPDEEGQRNAAVAVLGSKLRSELAGSEPVIGRMVRIGDRRYRVIGVLAPTGNAMGMAVDEMAYIPTEQAFALFNTSTLVRIFIETRDRAAIEATRTRVVNTLKARHDGEEDVTTITQDAVLGTFDKILSAITFGVAGIAAISLGVAGILVMNVMLVAVTQRTPEIGLLKALGASGAVIRLAFLTEAVLLSLGGAIVGVALGQLGAWGLRLAYPVLPAYPPYWAVAAGLGTAMLTGVLFGFLPARRAAGLHVVDALGRR
ncbi:ABC transporter permease [Uliginosibacterium sp. 31-16]|uniref:ABC transporter permease n=1 Tax=Uliginosibacterium sp. 31-16 TaxID=3068315 RepID=UPI00273E35EE|nr:ABC transporter permease [Uliginosibacterium sp. 31-16]MDP5238544.1 ABC transporter permease [Uliginosibacterium sp. 31-16]